MIKSRFYISCSILFAAALLLTYACENPSSSEDELVDEEIYISSNYISLDYPPIQQGSTLYRLDPETYELQEVPLQTDLDLLAYATFSSDRSHLIFNGSEYHEDTGSFDHFLVGYDLEQDTFDYIFAPDIPLTGGRLLYPGDDPMRPGLIYLWNNYHGMYAFDAFTGEQTSIASQAEDSRTILKTIKYSEDGRYVGVLAADGGKEYGQIEVFDTGTSLSSQVSHLNKDNKDSISVYDFELSEDGEEVYVVYQLSEARSRYIRAYAGEYDVETEKLTTYDAMLPWSVYSVFTAYSPKRNELYAVMGNDLFYIIDTKTGVLADSVHLESNSGGGSRIALFKDERMALISYPLDSYVGVIDLEERILTREIFFPDDYWPDKLLIR